MRLIVCGLKSKGPKHVKETIDAVIQADHKTQLVAGFDLVNEEDHSPGISEYIE